MLSKLNLERFIHGFGDGKDAAPGGGAVTSDPEVSGVTGGE